MLLKLKARNRLLLNDVVTSVMNIACVVSGSGYLPTEYDKTNLHASGRYWFENVKEDKFELLPRANNNKAFIRERGDYFLIIQFYCRYDTDNKKADALSNLILAFFSEDEVELATNE